MGDDDEDLKGRWVHVHEEDDAANRVFRRAGTALPPSRGRTELEVGDGMVASQRGPGMDDRSVDKAPVKLSFARGTTPTGQGTLWISSFDGDRLKIRKQDD